MEKLTLGQLRMVIDHLNNAPGYRPAQSQALALSPFYYNGQGVRPDLRKEIEAKGYTPQQYIDAARSVASYTICFALYEQHMAVRMMIDRLRQHPYNTFRGYKNELNHLEVYDRNRRRIEKDAMGSDQARLDIMCPVIHEDLEHNLQLMHYTAVNYYHRYHYPEAEIMAAAQVAQIVTDLTVNVIKARVLEIRQMLPQWNLNLENICPTRVCRSIEAVMARIAKCTTYQLPDEFDINNCQELQTGVKCMHEIISDVDRMELYIAYGIEMTEGPEVLLRDAPRSYYLLHPTEDPEYLKEKAAREAAEAEAEAAEAAS